MTFLQQLTYYNIHETQIFGLTQTRITEANFSFVSILLNDNYLLLEKEQENGAVWPKLTATIQGYSTSRFPS